MRTTIITGLVTLILACGASAQVERIWLTHRAPDPSRIVINWTTRQPGDSAVRFGPTPAYGHTIEWHEAMPHPLDPIASSGVRPEAPS